MTNPANPNAASIRRGNSTTRKNNSGTSCAARDIRHCCTHTRRTWNPGPGPTATLTSSWLNKKNPKDDFFFFFSIADGAECARVRSEALAGGGGGGFWEKQMELLALDSTYGDGLVPPQDGSVSTTVEWMNGERKQWLVAMIWRSVNGWSHVWGLGGGGGGGGVKGVKKE